MRKASVQYLAPIFVAVSLLQMSCSNTGGGFGQRTQAVSLLITLSNEVGRSVSDGNSLARSYYAYDVRGRTTASEHVLETVPYVYTTTFGFYCATDACTATSTAANGPAIVSMTFPDNDLVSYTFDAGDAHQKVSTKLSGQSPQDIVLSVTRNAVGQTTQVVLADGTEQDHCYNDGSTCACYTLSAGNCVSGTSPNTDLRINHLTTWVNATSEALQDYTYGFDPNNNVTSIADNLTTSLSATYGYDSLDQVTSMISGGTTYTYAYDSVRNLITKDNYPATGSITQTYGGTGRGPHALATSNGLTYHYDANGNLLTTTGGSSNAAITWNADNMPTTLNWGSNTTARSWVGEEVWKKVQTVSGTTTTTYYLPSLRVEDGLYRKYYGGFAERDTDGTLKFYHSDHLGSSSLVTNASGTVVHRAAYMPYGVDRTFNYTPPYTESFTPKYNFTFKEKQLDGSGYYHMGARMYNPATGRWLSADTVTTDGLNRYMYVMNNPLAYRDPTGHSGELPRTTSEDIDAMIRSITFPFLHPIQFWDQFGAAAYIAEHCVLGLCDIHNKTVQREMVSAGVNYGTLMMGPLLESAMARPIVPVSERISMTYLGKGEWTHAFDLHDGWVAKVPTAKGMREMSAESIVSNTVKGINETRRALKGIIDVPEAKLIKGNPELFLQRKAPGLTYDQLSVTAQGDAREAVAALRPEIDAATHNRVITDTYETNFTYTPSGRPISFVDPVTPTAARPWH